MRFEQVDSYRIGTYSWIVAGHAAVLYLLLASQWSYVLISLAVSFLILQVGLSLTFHRVLSHHAVKLPLWCEVIGTFIGGLALQGSSLSWVTIHRNHHRFTGTDKDPHSPKHKGSWYIHVFGYAFSKSNPKYGVDMFKTWHITFHKYYYKIYGALLFGSLLLLPWDLALALFWAPIGISFQFENLVNTWLHSWSDDRPSNNMWAQLFVLGDAYHENHHNNPGAIRNGKYDLIGFIAERCFKK